MPQVFRIGSYWVYFWVDESIPLEPIHVHVVKDGKEAKYNVVPEVKQVYNHGFKKNEISMIESVIEENTEVIISRWNEYFK